MGFDKFVWIKTLVADPAVSFRGKTIGTLCAISFVTYGEDTFAVRQKTIAARCGTSRKTVNLALGDVKAAGYLVKSRPRSQGPGRNGGDEWRLVFPECCHQSVHHSGEKWCNASVQHSESGVTPTAEWCNPNGQSGVTGLSECCNTPSSPTSAKDPPKVFKRSLEKGLYRGSGQEHKNPIQEQEHPPFRGTGMDEKRGRPQIGAKFHRVLKSTNIARAGSPHPPSQNDSRREERKRFGQRLKGVPTCTDCDDDGYLPDDTQCWHGKENPA